MWEGKRWNKYPTNGGGYQSLIQYLFRMLGRSCKSLCCCLHTPALIPEPLHCFASLSVEKKPLSASVLIATLFEDCLQRIHGKLRMFVCIFLDGLVVLLVCFFAWMLGAFAVLEKVNQGLNRTLTDVFQHRPAVLAFLYTVSASCRAADKSKRTMNSSHVFMRYKTSEYMNSTILCTFHSFPVSDTNVKSLAAVSV